MSGDGNKYQEYIAFSYAYQIVSSVPGIDHFLEDQYKYIMPFIEKDVDMIWNDEAKEKFESATHRHVCGKELNRLVDPIVRDHCHFTGQFRGAVHQYCNLDYKIDNSGHKLPIVFHNLCGYDVHLIFQKVKRKHGKINVIPNNSERYISFEVSRCYAVSDAMLKYTGVELELITDPDMHQMVEKSMRGNISNICHRYATSSHPNMDTYNKNEEPRPLTYQDANSLYSWAMSQMLPLRGFKWVSRDEVDILNVPVDSKLGYILEVDLEYRQGAA